jgi:hypothetical protein
MLRDQSTQNRKYWLKEKVKEKAFEFLTRQELTPGFIFKMSERARPRTQVAAAAAAADNVVTKQTSVFSQPTVDQGNFVDEILDDDFFKKHMRFLKKRSESGPAHDRWPGGYGGNKKSKKRKRTLRKRKSNKHRVQKKMQRKKSRHLKR